MPASPRIIDEHGQKSPSVAPVSISREPGAPHEPTVIVLRERPKLAWIVAAASLGALAAIAVTRLLAAPAPAASVNADEHAPSVNAAAATTAPPSAAVVLPVATPVASAAPVASVAPSASVAVVRFGEDQGVAIPRRPVAPPGAARPAPRTPKQAPLGPALPDGSFGLGHVDTLPSLTPAPVAAPPEPAKKRVLTPEQQLAEAQLKASMLK